MTNSQKGEICVMYANGFSLKKISDSLDFNYKQVEEFLLHDYLGKKWIKEPILEKKQSKINGDN